MKTTSLADRYNQRPQGSRQVRAAGIINQLDEQTGSDLIGTGKVAAQHIAQLCIELLPVKMIKNFDRACPEGGFGSKRARQLMPIGDQIIPGQVLEANRLGN